MITYTCRAWAWILGYTNGLKKTYSRLLWDHIVLMCLWVCLCSGSVCVLLCVFVVSVFIYVELRVYSTIYRRQTNRMKTYVRIEGSWKNFWRRKNQTHINFQQRGSKMGFLMFHALSRRKKATTDEKSHSSDHGGPHEFRVLQRNKK